MKTLSAGDAEALESFLAPQASSSMFLRANARDSSHSDFGRSMAASFGHWKCISLSTGVSGVVVYRTPPAGARRLSRAEVYGSSVPEARSFQGWGTHDAKRGRRCAPAS